MPEAGPLSQNKKASGYFFLMVVLAAFMFFGTAAWIVYHNSPGEQFRWMLDIFSAFLFISVFFWLLVLEDFRGGN